jgi:aquaporin Z
MKKILAEFISTFALLLAILETILLMADAEPGFALIAASVSAGVAVTVLIYIFGKYSGAHMNPAVSTALWLDNQLNTKLFIGYVLAQLAGSFCAAWVIDITHRDEFYLMGSTVPSLSEGYAWILEALLTFALMFVIFRFSDARYPRMNKWSAIAIGLVVTLEIYFAGAYSGASMNPARSFGPALIEGRGQFHWLYFSAPLVGAAIARYVDLLFRKREEQQDISADQE